eukprot:1561627-Rhodomonas_salina.1
MELRLCYALPGTEEGYAATRRERPEREEEEEKEARIAYGACDPATDITNLAICLRCHEALSGADLASGAMRCAVLIVRIVLRDMRTDQCGTGYWPSVCAMECPVLSERITLPGSARRMCTCSVAFPRYLPTRELCDVRYWHSVCDVRY